MSGIVGVKTPAGVRTLRKIMSDHVLWSRGGMMNDVTGGMCDRLVVMVRGDHGAMSLAQGIVR